MLILRANPDSEWQYLGPLSECAALLTAFGMSQSVFVQFQEVPIVQISFKRGFRPYIHIPFHMVHVI